MASEHLRDVDTTLPIVGVAACLFARLRTTNATSRMLTAFTRCGFRFMDGCDLGATKSVSVIDSTQPLSECQELDQKVYEKNFQNLEEGSLVFFA